MREPSGADEWALRLGRHELLIRQRYEVVSIVNDVLIAVWFIAGSVLFLLNIVLPGSWLFLAGSVELAARPMIRLVRHVHLVGLGRTGPPDEGQDF